jgi:hypothetical protein
MVMMENFPSKLRNKKRMLALLFSIAPKAVASEIRGKEGENEK